MSPDFLLMPANCSTFVVLLAPMAALVRSDVLPTFQGPMLNWVGCCELPVGHKHSGCGVPAELGLEGRNGGQLGKTSLA